MGMFAEFYSGDASSIVDGLHNRAKTGSWLIGDQIKCADFCLNLHGPDLDSLSKLIFQLLGRDAVGLFDSIARDVDAVPRQGYGIHEMSPAWAAVVALFSDERVDELATAWFKEMFAAEGAASWLPTNEAIRAIKDLLSVCRDSVSSRVPVIYFWSV